MVFYRHRRTCRDCMQAQQRQRRAAPRKPKARKSRERKPATTAELTGCPERIKLGVDALDDPRWSHLCMHGFYAADACDQPARWHFGAMRHCDRHRTRLDEPITNPGCDDETPG